VLPAPGGAKVRVTLVSYVPQVAEPSGNYVERRVFGLNIRLTNLGDTTVIARRPTYYAVLILNNALGASTVPHAKGPCGGSFYRTPIRLRPHSTSQGCIPYRYHAPPVRFAFGFGSHSVRWPVHI
jgi:hypothetical protein